MKDSAFSFNPVDRFRYVRVISRLNPRGARPSRRRSRITFGERGWERVSRAGEKRRKEMRRARCPSAVAAINRSDRAVALSLPLYVDTVSRPIFFSPSDVSCGIDSKTNGTIREWHDVARGHEENREKIR